MNTTTTQKATLNHVNEIVALILSLPSYPDAETDVLVMSGEEDLIKTVITNRVTSHEISLFIAERDSKIVGVGSLNKGTGYIGQLYFAPKDEETAMNLLETIEKEAVKAQTVALLIKITHQSYALERLVTEKGFAVLPTTEPQIAGNYFTKQIQQDPIALIEAPVVYTTKEKEPVMV